MDDIHYSLAQPETWPGPWTSLLAEQTLEHGSPDTDSTIYLTGWNLPETVPDLPTTLLEEIAWGLWANPKAGVIVLPFYVSIGANRPCTLSSCKMQSLDRILDTGGLAVWRTATIGTAPGQGSGGDGPMLRRVLAGGHWTILAKTRALIEEQLKFPAVKPVKQRVISALAKTEEFLCRRFTGRHTRRIPDTMRYMINIAQVTKDYLVASSTRGTILGKQQQWPPHIPSPTIRVRPARQDGRIHILMALHWLELGGAEKFSVDLIQRLPPDRYAIHVTTDVPSENSWASRIRQDVEEIIHLPEFLPRHQAGLFLEHLIRTRDIDIMHIHHSAWAYESLFYLRRSLLPLRVVDSLHIIELPPHAGGYPESSASRFEPFIDGHHVITDHLQRFLVQRWRVPEEKTCRIYLNVDTVHFDPDIVDAGTFRTKWQIPADALLVAFVGRFVRQKRPYEFVDMAALLSQRWLRQGSTRALHFVMAGSGPMCSKTIARTNAAGLTGSVTFTDEIRDPRPLYKDADMVVLSSENEGLALVTYEAMAMETVVVSTDVGAQSELVPPELIIPADGPVAKRLADVVWPLLTDDDRREQAGRSGRAHILRHHRVEQTIEEMDAFYRRFL